MELSGLIHRLPSQAKTLLVCFVVALSFGFYSGLFFVGENTNNTFQGIEEQYMGNEADEEALEMKFKKPLKEIVTLVHNHVLSMSVIFFLIGAILLLTSISPLLKKILIIEPFISLLLTFGGIWVMWSGVVWFKYVIMVSGILMTTTYTVSVIVILSQLLKKS
jgi:hypothetical protein